MAKKCWPVALLSLLALSLAAVPPHPSMPDWSTWAAGDDARPSTRFGGVKTATGERNLPQTVLAIMVEFTDVTFDETPGYPDSIAHDQAYFDRCMFHLNDYCHDASHGAYTFDWQVYDRVSLDNTMSWYGDDGEYRDENRVAMVDEVVAALDAEIDFAVWDALVLFHAGAGQESDIEESRPDELWSTFVNLYDLWEYLDPEAAEYDGIPTGDGVFITEMIILPESQWQPYFDETSPILGMLGVLAHQYGHQLGLPTLYDNDSSNGYSQGIGNWGVMGTGAWNALGYVPPMPCAWSRQFLGWETPLVITGDVHYIELAHNLDSLGMLPRLARVALSDEEYFLLENRQQNPDGSAVTWYNDDGSVSHTEASFSFEIVENQEYYPPPNNHIPKFDFMTNRYRGCEWDFYLPGLGGPAFNGNDLTDGSGLLIWHIDENVIAENFTPDFEYNTINGVSEHKGVDLEEADGVQHLDSNYPAVERYGSPGDSYRLGHNDYFGKKHNPVTEQLSLPTAESYYGGTILEILDIGASGNTMSFSTRFQWNLNADYSGINTLPAAYADFDLDGEPELFYPMSSGELVFWPQTSANWPDAIPLVGNLAWPWSWDQSNGRFLMPCRTAQNMAYLYTFDTQSDDMGIYPDKRWAGPIVALPAPFSTNGDSVRYLLPLAAMTAGEPDEVVGHDATQTQRWVLAMPFPLASNLMATETGFSVLLRTAEDLQLYHFDFASQAESLLPVAGTGIDSIVAAVQADIDPASAGDEICWLDVNRLLWLAGADGSLRPGFPVTIEQSSAAVPMLADADGNGTLDVIVGGENRFAVIGYDGETLNVLMPSLTSPDTTYTSAAVLPIDIDGDGLMEYAGAFSRNRFCIWDDALHYFEPMSGYPQSMPTRSRLLPVPVTDSLGSWLYIPSDYGKVYRTAFPGDMPDPPVWSDDFGGLGRAAAWIGPLPTNQNPAGSGVFYPGEVYLFPNPLNAIFGFDLTFHVRTRRTTEVNLKIYDIAGNCTHNSTVRCDADMPNREKFRLNTSRMSSGIYFAIVSAEGEVKRLPFAIEK
ncbi:MAG: M6 family metalloprotease domain-containing protein [Candidatus Cloacimonetes bacterium]|nr:M6 family metalloprotease domain-containing protein [Candidatus Cloacimonadota bacterium]